MKQYDLFVIGSGPAGQKAAVRAAKAGKKVAICEQLREIGGACVHQGTIPSKALRECALRRSRTIELLHQNGLSAPALTGSISDLIGEMGEVLSSHDRYMTAQLNRNNIDIVHGRASFVDPHTLSVRFTSGKMASFGARHVMIATGSRPRCPDNVAIDHENIYDSDSILSLAYLPESMVVLGGGVIACEYASIFALLGAKVTLVDRYPSPMGFLEPELVEGFLQGFEDTGGNFVGGVSVEDVAFDGISSVITKLVGGDRIVSDKVLCALGRVSRLEGLKIDKANVAISDRDLISVDDFGQTNVPHIYAAGDVVGPPSLASTSMEQGRRAVCHMLGVAPGSPWEWVPTGIYSIPELSSIGLTSAQTLDKYGGVINGFAKYNEIARGQIAGTQNGLLKLVVSPDRVVRGIHIVGEQATDLIHIGQMGLINEVTVDTYIERVFNFPTYAESYRVAAIHAATQHTQAYKQKAG